MYSQVSSQSWINLYFGIWPSSIFKPNKNPPKHPIFFWYSFAKRLINGSPVGITAFLSAHFWRDCHKTIWAKKCQQKGLRKLWEKQKLMSFCFFWLFRVYLGLRVLKFICYVFKICFSFYVVFIVFVFKTCFLSIHSRNQSSWRKTTLHWDGISSGPCLLKLQLPIFGVEQELCIESGISIHHAARSSCFQSPLVHLSTV